MRNEEREASSNLVTASLHGENDDNDDDTDNDSLRSRRLLIRQCQNQGVPEAVRHLLASIHPDKASQDRQALRDFAHHILKKARNEKKTNDDDDDDVSTMDNINVTSTRTPMTMVSPQLLDQQFASSKNYIEETKKMNLMNPYTQTYNAESDENLFHVLEKLLKPLDIKVDNTKNNESHCACASAQALWPTEADRLVSWKKKWDVMRSWDVETKDGEMTASDRSILLYHEWMSGFNGNSDDFLLLMDPGKDMSSNFVRKILLTEHWTRCVSMLAMAITKWDMTSIYSILFHPSLEKIWQEREGMIGNIDVLSCVVFVVRVYIAMNALHRSNFDSSLLKKVVLCLDSLSRTAQKIIISTTKYQDVTASGECKKLQVQESDDHPLNSKSEVSDASFSKSAKRSIEAVNLGLSTDILSSDASSMISVLSDEETTMMKKKKEDWFVDV